jgi:hypothetical protein
MNNAPLSCLINCHRILQLTINNNSINSNNLTINNNSINSNNLTINTFSINNRVDPLETWLPKTSLNRQPKRAFRVNPSKPPLPRSWLLLCKSVESASCR